MRIPTFAIAAILALSAGASAQDGGKLPWRGKTGDPKYAIADAKREGKAILLFFTSDG